VSDLAICCHSRLLGEPAAFHGTNVQKCELVANPSKRDRTGQRFFWEAIAKRTGFCPLAFEASFAQASNEMFYHVRLPPNCQPLVRRISDIRALREEST
jgi:hypothetical protein